MYTASSSSLASCTGVGTARLLPTGVVWPLETLKGSDVDGGVVHVIPVGRSLDKEGVSRLVCEASRDYVGPITVSYIVTNDKIQDRTNHSSGFSRDIAFVTLAEAARVTVSPES